MGQDGANWMRRSTDRCPTYRICIGCAGSGASGMHCQKCKMKERYYRCPFIHCEYTMQKWMGAEWILRMLQTTHMDARADRIQTYPFPCTPCVQITETWIKTNIYQRYQW
jgi:hypothetical protein